MNKIKPQQLLTNTISNVEISEGRFLANIIAILNNKALNVAKIIEMILILHLIVKSIIDSSEK
ncbi:hypothetical protein [Orientia tsutsugamushi]|uniref:hypothetical protein n=1 Tax=Orientia tsutsugamushi TaxID=784 RepID=UPI001E2D7862|nr:hypothetical protein [Orientia tsutsugamushi]